MLLAQWIRRQPDFDNPSSEQSALPALYADLAAHRHSNRSSFDASVAWWKDVLSKACMAGAASTTAAAASATLPSASRQTVTQPGDRLVLRVDQALLDALTIEEVGRPLGLGTVVSELRTERSLINIASFLASSTPIAGPAPTNRTLASRTLAFASSPITWAMSQLSISLGVDQRDGSESSEADWRKARGDWVVWSNAHALAESIVARHRAKPRLSPIDCLFSRNSFRSQLVEPALADLCAATIEAEDATKPLLTDRDFSILLKHLTRDWGFAQVQGDVVKLEKETDEDMRFVKISEQERGIVNVRDTYSKVETQIEEVEQRIKERQGKVEESLKRGSRTQALSYLRSRKALEALLDKRVGALDTLHGVLLKIEQAASDIEIMKAYETSTASLKTLLSDAHLQPDRIDASMDVMQETLADADEVRRAVEIGQDGMRQAAGMSDDTDEIEAELAAMQKEAEQDTTKASEKIPEVVQGSEQAPSTQTSQAHSNAELAQVDVPQNTGATSQDEEHEQSRTAEVELAM